DVGANIGYFTLLASKLVGDSGAVVAIEAFPATFDALQRNLARNRARNVRAVNAAASDCNSVVRLFRGPATHIGLTKILVEEGIRRGLEFECEVTVAPFTIVLRSGELQLARLLKIEVVG